MKKIILSFCICLFFVYLICCYYERLQAEQNTFNARMISGLSFVDVRHKNGANVYVLIDSNLRSIEENKDSVLFGWIHRNKSNKIEKKIQHLKKWKREFDAEWP